MTKSKMQTGIPREEVIDQFARQYPKVLKTHTRAEIAAEAKRQGAPATCFSTDDKGCVEMAFLELTWRPKR